MDKLNADCLKQLRPFEAELVIKALRLKKKHEEINPETLAQGTGKKNSIADKQRRNLDTQWVSG